MNDKSNHSNNNPSLNNLKLKKLTADQIQQIDDFIASVGDYGEVHLVIQRGQLKYINKMESHKAWNDEGGHGP